uniref:Uncharacterized protein n=1 Tax=Parastrongyloides trichosuri TaxID=131310 RepID=A0A0N4ZR67_PARTI
MTKKIEDKTLDIVNILVQDKKDYKGTNISNTKKKAVGTLKGTKLPDDLKKKEGIFCNYKTAYGSFSQAKKEILQKVAGISISDTYSSVSVSATSEVLEHPDTSYIATLIFTRMLFCILLYDFIWIGCLIGTYIYSLYMFRRRIRFLPTLSSIFIIALLIIHSVVLFLAFRMRKVAIFKFINDEVEQEINARRKLNLKKELLEFSKINKNINRSSTFNDEKLLDVTQESESVKDLKSESEKNISESERRIDKIDSKMIQKA